MKTWFMAALLSVVTLVPGLCLIYYSNKQAPVRVEMPVAEPNYIASFHFEQTPVVKNLEPGTVFEVKACRVIDAYRYEMWLEGEKQIEAHLSVATKEEANTYVVDMLNRASEYPPTVTLLRKVDGYWIVDFELTVDRQRIKMSQLLREKKLIL